VSASRIAVENIYKDGDRVKAELDFGVISRDYPAVMAMIANMNGSGLFQAELRGQDRQQNERRHLSPNTLFIWFIHRLTVTLRHRRMRSPGRVKEVLSNERAGTS
jgi:hypothetical protein